MKIFAMERVEEVNARGRWECGKKYGVQIKKNNEGIVILLESSQQQESLH